MRNLCALSLLSLAIIPSSVAITDDSAPPSSVAELPTFVIVGGGFKGAFIAANLVRPDRNRVLLLEKTDVLVRSWDDIRLSRALAEYGREKVYNGALDSSPSPSDVRQVQTELRDILSRTTVDSQEISHRVQERLERLGVQVVTNCNFTDTSLKVNPDKSLTLGCSENEPLLTRVNEGNQTVPFILVDARAKPVYSWFREQANKLIATEAKLPDWLNINGYATTSHAIFPLPLLLGQKVRVKSYTSLWTSTSNIPQFSARAQSFLEKMFKALELQGKVTINSIDANKTKFYPYFAGSFDDRHAIRDGWMMRGMCDNLTAIHGMGSNNCDEFASKTLAGAWCDHADYCKPNASTIALNRTWSSFVDGVCPLKGADGSTREYSGLKPVACFSKAEVRENERLGKDKGGTGSDDSTNLYFFGRWTYPTNPGAEDVVNATLNLTLAHQNLNATLNDTLANQPSVFYVNLGYTTATVDVTVHEALSYFVQALTGHRGDFKEGGLLAFTRGTQKDRLALAASGSLLQNYTDGVCQCLGKKFKTLECSTAAANKSNIVACYEDVQHPLIGMNDLMREESGGYFPGRPINSDVDTDDDGDAQFELWGSALNLWAGVPNFGTLGIFPVPHGVNVPVKALKAIGCKTTIDGGTQWGQNWTCPNVTTVDVDLRDYMPKSNVDSLSRFVGSNASVVIPFKLTAYYFYKGNTPKSCTCRSLRFARCECAGSALIGVTSDIELDLIDKLEPFVGQNCARIRASLEDFASNFWDWKEKAAISLLQKVLQGCDDHFEMSFVAAAATAEEHTWKVTAIVLGSVLAAVLLVAAGFLVVRARSNSGSAIVGAGAGAGAGTSSSAGGQSGTELM